MRPGGMVRDPMIKDIEVVIGAGARTPFVKAFADLKKIDAADLGVAVVKGMLGPLAPENVNKLVWGNVLQPVRYPNISRVIALRAGLREKMPSYSVNMNCASGLTAVNLAYQTVALGRADLIIAGGCESMSNANLELPTSFTEKAVRVTKAKGVSKVGALARFRPSDLKPRMPSFKDPICGLSMGETAEVLAQEFNISRKEQDEFALQSHKRAISATVDGSFKREIVPVKKGKLDRDVGPRKDTTLKRLAKLKPVFDKKGSVTAGNSSPITDGGAGVIVASRSEAEELGLKGTVAIRDYFEIGVDPKRMGLGPAFVAGELLSRNGLTPEDFDLFEINEAFAAQVLAVLKALDDPGFCKRKLGLKKKVGVIPLKKLNPQGGAIALGHPVGATGARLALTAVRQMVDRKLDRGLVALCVSGGLGAGMILEKI
jgi:acetyl-CoA acetyltransferase family protein